MIHSKRSHWRTRLMVIVMLTISSILVVQPIHAEKKRGGGKQRARAANRQSNRSANRRSTGRPSRNPSRSVRKSVPSRTKSFRSESNPSRSVRKSVPSRTKSFRSESKSSRSSSNRPSRQSTSRSNGKTSRIPKSIDRKQSPRVRQQPSTKKTGQVPGRSVPRPVRSDTKRIPPSTTKSRAEGVQQVPKNVRPSGPQKSRKNSTKQPKDKSKTRKVPSEPAQVQTRSPDKNRKLNAPPQASRRRLSEKAKPRKTDSDSKDEPGKNVVSKDKNRKLNGPPRASRRRLSEKAKPGKTDSDSKDEPGKNVVSKDKTKGTKRNRSNRDRNAIQGKPGEAGRRAGGKGTRLNDPGKTSDTADKPSKQRLRAIRIGRNGKADKTPGANEKHEERLAKILKRRKSNRDLLIRSKSGKSLDIEKQLDLSRKGDVARRLGLRDRLARRGGWRKHARHGPISNRFVHLHFGYRYPGHYSTPNWCWFPRWNPWTQWCWWDTCAPIFDPRPVICRPLIYPPCPTWTVVDIPVWQPLPITVCGTWVDVPPLVVEQPDLQLLAVRFVDPGHPEQQLGARHRVWFRNNGNQDIDRPFNVLVLVGNDDQLHDELPQAGVRVPSIEAGQTQSVDIRLSFDSSQQDLDDTADRVAFSYLHIVLDSDHEISEPQEDNNGIVLVRKDILPVDPAAFSTDVSAAKVGSLINIAGEGFGPEPGRVVVFVKGLELDAEIHGWFDLGVRVKLPALPVAYATEAELLVVRGDEATSEALPLTLLPAEDADSVPAPEPVSETPLGPQEL